MANNVQVGNALDGVVSGELQACRTAWEASDHSVPFPDYWAGWQAAAFRGWTVANLAGQLNAALQPTLDGEAFKKLRLQRDDALHEVATLRELVPAHVEKAFDRASNRRTALENALYAFGFSVTWGAGDKLTVEREESDADVRDLLAAPLYEFDDGVNGGRDEPIPALDAARKIVDAKEWGK